MVSFGKVEQQELVRRGGFVFRLFDIDAAHVIAAIDEILRQVMTDKTACARYQYFCLL